MKKIIKSMACALVLAATAQADFLRVELGTGAWMQEPSGGIFGNSNGFSGSDVSSEDQKTQGYAWLLIKHFVPVVPNLRVEYVALTNEGKATGTFNNQTIPIGGSAESKFEMTQVDLIPYYNLLDNTAWITVDVGVDIKLIDATYKIDPVGTFNGYEKSESLPLPLGYVRGRVQIPTTDIGIEADVKYVSYSDSTAYDVRAKVDYTFDITPLIQPAIEVGYRMQKYEVDELSDIKLDLEFAGFYAGAMLRF